MSSSWTLRRRQKRKFESYLRESEDISGSIASTSTGLSQHQRNDKRSTGTSLSDSEVQVDASLCFDNNSSNIADDPYVLVSSYSTGSDLSVDSEESTEVLLPYKSVDTETLVRNWAIKHQIKHCALRDIIKIVNAKYNANLPSDPRTICKTPSGLTDRIKKICGGEYFHFGLKNSLEEFLESIPDAERSKVRSVSLKVNCDGIPLSKSSGKQFWPILVQFCNGNETIISKPAPVAIFLGVSKPNSVQEYLQSFLDEMLELERGFDFKGSKFTISIKSFICDAPARQFLKCIKSHSGYSSCERCQQHGNYEGTVTFPELDAEKRTDSNFASMEDNDHHRSQSPLLALNIGLVSQFVLDPMHLLYLGVMRKLLSLWLKRPLPTRIGSQCKEQISAQLEEFANYMPCEFNRKPRSLNDVDRYKATEFRAFLLYTGPVCLQKYIDENVYKNFLLLSVSTFLLSVPRDPETVEMAHKYLIAFVNHFKDLYGSRNVVYNVHNLSHLTDDVNRHGSVDKFSAFPFENYLGYLKNLLRKPNCLLIQIVNRIYEMKAYEPEEKISEYPIAKGVHRNGPISSDLSCVQFKVLYLKNFCIKVNPANRGIMVNSKVGKVVNIVKYEGDPEIYVLYHVYKVYEDLYTYPVQSSSLGIYIVSKESKSIRTCSYRDIECKCILFPLQSRLSKFASFPLLHTVHQQ